MLEEDKSRKGGKTACIKPYALVFTKQKSPRSYPIRGPQQPGGNLDTSGAGSMNCRCKGCRKVRNLKLGCGWQVSPPHQFLTFFTGFGLASIHRYAFLFRPSFPRSLQEHLGELSPFLLLHLQVKSHLMVLTSMCLPSPFSATTAAGVRTASLTLPSPNLSAGRSLLFSHQHAQQSRQLPSAIIRPHLTPPSTASCWYN